MIVHRRPHRTRALPRLDWPILRLLIKLTHPINDLAKARWELKVHPESHVVSRPRREASANDQLVNPEQFQSLPDCIHGDAETAGEGEGKRFGADEEGAHHEFGLLAQKEVGVELVGVGHGVWRGGGAKEV